MTHNPVESGRNPSATRNSRPERFYRGVIVKSQVRPISLDAQPVKRLSVAWHGRGVDRPEVLLAPDFGNAVVAEGVDKLTCVPARAAIQAACMERRQCTVQRMRAAGFGSQADIDAQKERCPGPVNALVGALAPHVRAQVSQ